ncbi:hypothetical protein ACFLV0_07010, partial [Chloroflexota bacterium]
YQVDERLAVTGSANPGVVVIYTKDGSKYRKRIDVLYGSPQRPMSMEDIIKKFKDCAGYAVKPLPEKNINKVIDMVTSLEDVEDVTEIMRLLG